MGANESTSSARRGFMERARQPVAQHALGIFFMLLALGYRGGQFVQRYHVEPERLGWFDTRYQHAAAHAWLAGRSPYSAEAMAEFAPKHELGIEPYPYPPNTLPMISPLGLMEYDQSRFALAAVNTLSMAVIAGALLWMGLVFTRRRAVEWGVLASWMGAAFSVLNSVAVVNIWLGQLTSLPAAFAILGIAIAYRGRVTAGAGVAALGAIKPQLVIFLLPMMMVRWPKRATIGIVAVGVLTVLPAMITLGFPAMITDWLHAVKVRNDMGANAPGSPVTFGIRYMLFDLGLPAIEVAPVGLAFLVVAWCLRRRLGDGALMILTLPTALLFFPAMTYYQVAATPVFALLLWYSSRRMWTLAIAMIALAPAIKVLPQVLPMIGNRQQELWLLGVTVATLVIGAMWPEKVEADKKQAPVRSVELPG